MITEITSDIEVVAYGTEVHIYEPGDPAADICRSRRLEQRPG
jgi:hypothetical protein